MLALFITLICKKYGIFVLRYTENEIISIIANVLMSTMDLSCIIIFTIFLIMRYMCIYHGASIQDILDHEIMKFIRWFVTIITIVITTLQCIFISAKDEVTFSFLMNEKYWR